MRSFKGQSILLVSILLSLCAIISANTVAQTCQLVPNNTYVADPTSCAMWAFCINGQPRYVGQCENGKLYNSQSGQCTLANQATCATGNVNAICSGLNGVYRADPTNCQNYCYCQNGVAGCSQCPNGLVFNPITSNCVASYTYACAASSPCALVPNNIPVQDVNSCSSYYVCSNGVGSARTCSNGFLYNAIKGSCDYPSNVVCPNSSNPGFPNPSYPPIPSYPPGNGDNNLPPTGSSSACARLGYGQQMVSDGATCQGYYYCANGVSTIQPVWQECPNGSHFSQNLQQCTNPYSVSCPYNRCEGLTYKFVTALNTNCKEYFVCNNGATKLNSEANCPTNFPYFDEFRQACVPNLPKYAVCN